MPCMDPAHEITAAENERERVELGRMLCAALHCIDQYEIKMPKECVKWWKKHKEMDLERAAEVAQELKVERKRQDALDKLKKVLSKKELRLIAESLRNGDLM